MLSKEQVDFFQNNGYLVADFNLDHEFIDAIVRKIYPHYDAKFRENPVFATRVQDGWKFVEEVHKLAVHPGILDALQQLYGRRPKPFQTLNFPIGTSQSPHSDIIHFNSIPHGFMAGAWAALEDINENNGPLIYYPGSHKLPEYNMQSFGLGTGHKNYPGYEKAILDVIKEHDLKPEYGVVKKGEVLFWHANLIHGGTQQIDRSRSRHSQVTHYYFEDCKYYTPLLSTENDIQYRMPSWLPKKTKAGPIKKFLRRHVGRYRG